MASKVISMGVSVLVVNDCVKSLRNGLPLIVSGLTFTWNVCDVLFPCWSVTVTVTLVVPWCWVVLSTATHDFLSRKRSTPLPS